MLRVGSSLIGYDVEAADGGEGSVEDIMFDDVTWRMRWLVINFGDVLNRHRGLVHPSELGLVDPQGEGIQVKVARATIEASPCNLLVSKLTMGMEARLYDYFDLNPAWGDSTFGVTIAPTANSNKIDPHLCSLNKAIGQDVHAIDGNIGHLEDIVIDDIDWLIYYLIVDASSWWSGRHVLVSPHAIKASEAGNEMISLNTTRDKIRSSPPWKQNQQVDEGYQAQLHNHYGWPSHRAG